ncbi:MAG: hypothetical protein HYT87_02905 [Nitrospirae bacterium]|nr:hypothetical protein [Nitrospirota bacterium]
MNLNELRRRSREELDRVFEAGSKPSFDRWVGFEFRGFNPPMFARILGFQKFKKGFFLKEQAGKKAPFGYNIPVRQSRPEDPWVCKPSDDHPKRFGFYLVRDGSEAGEKSPKADSLFLDYGSGGNPAADVTKFIRDFVVQVEPKNADLYLGQARIAIGPAWLFTNYFILERDRPAPSFTG